MLYILFSVHKKRKKMGPKHLPFDL